MTLQDKTIQQYRQLFPNEALREVSERTGIQITRVFRLFNGKVMKVKELEAFERAINSKKNENPSLAGLAYVIDEASAHLTSDELSKITEYIARKLAAKNFCRGYVRSTYESAIIA